MSFIGKILVVVLLVLSVCFMAFAGAVFATHQNWKTVAEQRQESIQSEKERYDTLNTELEQLRTETARTVSELEQSVTELTQERNQLAQQFDDERLKAEQLEQELKTATGLAEAKAEEAGFREGEAATRREANKMLYARVDDLTGQLRTAQDDLFSYQLQIEELAEKHDRLLAQNNDLRRALKANNLSDEPSDYSLTSTPPPPVDGLVTDVRKDRRNQIEYVEVSIGSDDGLKVGDQLDVYRSEAQGASETRYLGKIEIIRVQNDQAVARVVRAARNGIIAIGDNVTTRL